MTERPAQVEYELTECPHMPRLVGTIWGREVAFVSPDCFTPRYVYRALEPRSLEEHGRFAASCMEWTDGDAWLPDHMGTWVAVA